MPAPICRNVPIHCHISYPDMFALLAYPALHRLWQCGRVVSGIHLPATELRVSARAGGWPLCSRKLQLAAEQGPSHPTVQEHPSILHTKKWEATHPQEATSQP